MRGRTLLCGGALVLTGIACIDSSRINRTCTWAEGSSQRLDLSKSADRDHLRADVQVAADLAVRFGDALSRSRADIGGPRQRACTAAMIDSIARRHDIASDRVVEAEYARVWWADLPLVYLPLAIATALAVTRMTRRVCRSFDPEDRAMAIASVTFLVPVAALIALGAGQCWAFLVESVLVHNPHVAFRAFFIPIILHGWIAFFSLLPLCAAVAATIFTKTPLRRVEHSYQYLRAVPSRS